MQRVGVVALRKTKDKGKSSVRLRLPPPLKKEALRACPHKNHQRTLGGTDRADQGFGCRI